MSQCLTVPTSYDLSAVWCGGDVFRACMCVKLGELKGPPGAGGRHIGWRDHGQRTKWYVLRL